MVLVLTLFVVGAGIGYLLRSYQRWIPAVDFLTKLAIVVMLFLLGVNVGKNEEIIANISTIGMQAFWLTLGAMAGSVLIIWTGCRYLFFRKCTM